MSSFSFQLASGEVVTVEDVDGVYTLNEFHAEEAISHLIELFKHGPRNQELLRVIGLQIQELENTSAEVFVGFYVDTATGDQLDILGRIVGETRQGRNDDDYRAAVKVRILVNLSDGKAEQMLEISRAMIPGATVQLQEVYPMTVRFEFSALGSVSLRTVFNMLEQAKAGGVRLLVSYGPPTIGAVDGDPAGGIIGAVDGDPAGFIISGGT